MAVVRRVGFWLVLIPAALLLIIFALANRQRVFLSLNPFAAGDSGLEMPLFLDVFLMLGFGAIVGAFLNWLGQRRWRVAAKRQEREIDALLSDLARLKAEPRPAPQQEWSVLPPV